MVSSILEEMGHRVVYGDTDSCFFTRKTTDISYKDILSDLTTKVRQFHVLRTMSFSYDVMDSVILLSKKCYAMMDNAEVKYKRLEIVRKDRAPMISNFSCLP